MDRDALMRHLAAKYAWWLSSDEAFKRPTLLLCQVMQLGTWDGGAFDYAGIRTHYDSVLAAAPPLFATLVDELR